MALAGQIVVYRGTVYAIGRITGAARGYAGMPVPKPTYHLVAVGGDDPTTVLVIDPLADEIPYLPPCDTCGAGKAARCLDGCHTGTEGRA